MKHISDRVVATSAVLSDSVYSENPREYIEQNFWNVQHGISSVCPAVNFPDLQYCVATNEKEKEVYVAFRGTDNWQDVFSDVNIMTRTAKGWEGVFHAGFMNKVDTINLQHFSPWLVSNYKLIFCGHSFGGAVAGICAMILLARTGLKEQIFSVAFGAPLVTDGIGRKYMETIGIKDNIVWYVNENDIVPAAVTLAKRVTEMLSTSMKVADLFHSAVDIVKKIVCPTIPSSIVSLIAKLAVMAVKGVIANFTCLTCAGTYFYHSGTKFTFFADEELPFTYTGSVVPATSMHRMATYIGKILLPQGKNNEMREDPYLSPKPIVEAPNQPTESSSNFFYSIDNVNKIMSPFIYRLRIDGVMLQFSLNLKIGGPSVRVIRGPCSYFSAEYTVYSDLPLSNKVKATMYTHFGCMEFTIDPTRFEPRKYQGILHEHYSAVDYIHLLETYNIRSRAALKNIEQIVLLYERYDRSLQNLKLGEKIAKIIPKVEELKYNYSLAQKLLIGGGVMAGVAALGVGVFFGAPIVAAYFVGGYAVGGVGLTTVAVTTAGNSMLALGGLGGVGAVVATTSLVLRESQERLKAFHDMMHLYLESGNFNTDQSTIVEKTEEVYNAYSGNFQLVHSSDDLLSVWDSRCLFNSKLRNVANHQRAKVIYGLHLTCALHDLRTCLIERKVAMTFVDQTWDMFCWKNLQSRTNFSKLLEEFQVKPISNLEENSFVDDVFVAILPFGGKYLTDQQAITLEQIASINYKKAIVCWDISDQQIRGYTERDLEMFIETCTGLIGRVKVERGATHIAIVTRHVQRNPCGNVHDYEMISHWMKELLPRC